MYKLTTNKVNNAIREMKHNYWETFSPDMEPDLAPVSEYIQLAESN